MNSWVPILLYHRVVPKVPPGNTMSLCVSTAVFESQLRWLAMRGYANVPLASVGTQKALPSRSVVITFDDGYLDNYLYAWPALMRFGFTATIFVVTDAIGKDNTFDATSGTDRTQMLSAAQIQEMHRQGIDFGSHSCTHPDTLAALPDDRLNAELIRSRQVLEEILEDKVRHFSYPHSKHDARVEKAVETAGYSLACSGVGTRFSPFCLKRVQPPSQGGPALEAQMHWRYLKWLVKRRVLKSQDSESGN